MCRAVEEQRLGHAVGLGERERDRQTGRQTDRQTDRHRERQR